MMIWKREILKTKIPAVGLCLVIAGMMTACGRNVGPLPQPQQPETPAVETPKQEEAPAVEAPKQEETPTVETAPKPATGDGQISPDEAKAVALEDADVIGEVTYTKAKLDYEDGIAIYEIEFFADNTEYEYEINAATGSVYSKSVEAHHGHAEKVPVQDVTLGASDAYIDADSAVAAALAHAGFSDTDVRITKQEFDYDDGRAEYEIEFYKDGREYEYTIDAADGSVLEYDID
ncbi:MAG: PepSY domain-containing protein [Bacteroidales bacterium]|nr:PepSY domain-containing protein [Bacteroidales bacterium]MCM1416102.1 PepSY domain-containing protein [bacterium]MCM1422834.1 PepSY domain-containing protein [bacterium]